VLGAHTTRQRTFTGDDVHFLQAAANVLAIAVERKRVDETLRVTNQELRGTRHYLTLLIESST
ncbi:MAG: hypothetical protein GTN93_00720, partial [Anaerolineae bacterium]|nr:hypothetical protein [Anaerolineae bacterium]